MLASLSPARRRVVLGFAALVAAALVTAVVVVIASRSPARTTAVSQAVAGPVLLVPGYGGSQSSLTTLAAALRAAGRDAEVVALPGQALGDLDAQAGALAGAVTDALRRTKAPSVDVVGYSAGGVVARLWARNHGGASLARRVITIGSPNHGTATAAVGSLVPGACPTACQQLAPGSAVLAALNQGDETPAGPQWVSLWTTHDDVVLPPDSASLDGALDVPVQSVCASDSVDHTGLPRDPVVVRIVLAELSGPVVTPAPGCAPG